MCCRPQVVDCILSLRDWYTAANHSPSALSAHSIQPLNYGTSTTSLCPAASATPLSGAASIGQMARLNLSATPSPVMGVPAAGGSTFTPQAADFVSRHNAHLGEARDGLNYLMKSCNYMLKTRMGLPATPLPVVPQPGAVNNPEVALDAVGPVLETVLANITAVRLNFLVCKSHLYSQ